jgi:hypothetical protein
MPRLAGRAIRSIGEFAKNQMARPGVKFAGNVLAGPVGVGATIGAATSLYEGGDIKQSAKAALAGGVLGAGAGAASYLLGKGAARTRNARWAKNLSGITNPEQLNAARKLYTNAAAAIGRGDLGFGNLSRIKGYLATGVVSAGMGVGFARLRSNRAGGISGGSYSEVPLDERLDYDLRKAKGLAAIEMEKDKWKKQLWGR